MKKKKKNPSRSQSISKSNHLSFSYQINLLITQKKKKDPSANSKDSNLITKNNIFGHKTCTFQREKNAYELTQKLKKLDAPPTPPQERDGLSRLVSLLHGNNMDSTIRVDQVEEREGKLCVK